MHVFRKECYINNGKNTFFTEWYNVIINDFNVFKGILEKYPNSEEKESLLFCIDDVLANINHQFDEENVNDANLGNVIMHSTPNFFLFSYYAGTRDIPTYVLFSKDYKKFLIGEENMELFDDDENMGDHDRYGLYDYNYFELQNGKITYRNLERKEYNYEFTEYFEYVFDVENNKIEYVEEEKEYNRRFTMKFNLS